MVLLTVLTWVEGTDLKVIVQQKEGSKSVITMVKANYTIGNLMKKVAYIPLQSLKDKGPSAAALTSQTPTNKQ